MTAWDDYQSAAQRLDRVRQDAAAAVAEHTAALQAAQQELTGVRQRIALQRARIVDIGTRAGVPVPPLDNPVPLPDPPEPLPPAAIADLLRSATADLDTADATLSEVDSGSFTRGPFPHWPQPLRNIAVYGAVAALVLLLDLWLLFGQSDTTTEVVALAFAAILPAIGYGVAVASIGILYGKVERNPVLGAAISAFPVVALCLWTVVTSVLG